MRISDYFEKAAAYQPDAEYAVFRDLRITYGEARRKVHAIAHALYREGLKPGAHVGIYSTNDHNVSLLQLGINRADLAWLGVHDRNSIKTNAVVLDTLDCRFVFFHSCYENEVAQLKPQLTEVKRWICTDRVSEVGPFLDEWIAGEESAFPYTRANMAQPACLIPTGGTTGPSKGAVQSHYSLEVQMLALSKAFEMDATSRLLSIAPLSHAAGQFALGLLPCGGTNVVLSGFDPETVLRTIERQQITHTFLPPTLVYMLLAHPGVERTDFSSLKLLLVGAAPFAPEKFREAVRVFGPVLWEAFAQSETLIPVTYKKPGDYLLPDGQFDEAVLRSAGKPAETMHVEIMDDDGSVLARGERGEIVVRSSMLLTEYYNNPEATAESQAFGFHHTGDVGFMDDAGFLTIVDRKKDMIVTGAFNVYPAEIEKVICEMSEILDCIVIGVPDEKWGEAVKAVVQFKPGRSVDEKQIIDHCRSQLGGVKTPKSVECWDELPRSPVGKLLRRVVRDKFWQGHQRSI